MNYFQVFVLFTLLVVNGYSADAWFDLVKLNKDSAVCLDGSPGAYYISRDGDPSKILLYFGGGGWCGDKDLPLTLQNCYQRSKTDLGSSKNYIQNFSLSEGILSLSDQNNFKGWKKVILSYCDGSGHQGTKSSPVVYKDTKLYFRGHNITVEQFNSLQQKIGLFSKSTHVVVSGLSAGGLATFLWTNYVAERVKLGKVWSMPDSGIFYDSLNINSKKPQYKQSLANVMKISNVQIDPPVPQCVKNFPHAKQNCMLAQNIYKHIKVPQFQIQSLYDTWSIPNILGINCIKDSSLEKCNSTQRAVIEQYHKNVSNVLIGIGRQAINGYWAPVCANHVYSWGDSYYNKEYRIPENSQNSISLTVQKWLNGPSSSNKHMDAGEWPNNSPCSGTQKGFVPLSHNYPFLRFTQSTSVLI